MRVGSCTGGSPVSKPQDRATDGHPCTLRCLRWAPGGCGPSQHCAVSMSIPGKAGPGEDSAHLFLEPCGYDSVADGAQAGVGVTAGGHLHEGEHPPHGGAARLCPTGHKQRGRHSTKVARCAAATYGSLRMQRQPGELPESADGGGARAAAPAEARDEQREEEEQQADWGPGEPGAACPKGKKLSSTCSQDTSRAEGPMTAATGPRGPTGL
nr:uncharacterized protein LOC118967963 isoform X2 [Manis javanica]